MFLDLRLELAFVQLVMLVQGFLTSLLQYPFQLHVTLVGLSTSTILAESEVLRVHAIVEEAKADQEANDDQEA